MKNPTAEELAVLRERAERTFSRFPVLPRREDGRMSPESRLRFELTLETILEKNRALGACVVLRRPSGAHETFCFGTARLLGRVPVTEETCFRVASVSISAAEGWNLTAFGDKASLAGEKVDSNKLGFAMSIGGGAPVATSTGEATQSLITAPIEGCYMTGVGDSSRNSVAIDYDAIVTPLSGAVEGANVANVVFVIEWDDVTE